MGKHAPQPLQFVHVAKSRSLSNVHRKAAADVGWRVVVSSFTQSRHEFRILPVEQTKLKRNGANANQSESTTVYLIDLDGAVIIIRGKCLISRSTAA
jgi:hypothetical protein